MPEIEYMSLTQLTAWMTEHGVERSRAEWYRRVHARRFGTKLGAQWVVSRADAQVELERCRRQER